MEGVHKNTGYSVRSGSYCYFLRLDSYKDIDLVTGIMEKDKENEIPFSIESFRSWATRAVNRKRVLISCAVKGKEPIGFSIAFGPWELDRDVWVFYAYILPEHRTTEAVKEGAQMIKDWAEFCGAEGVNFETDNPDAWNRIFETEKQFRYKFKKEVR